MTEPKKRRTFAEWLRDTLICYVLPIGLVVYVNLTKCWPYQLMRDLIPKGSKASRSLHSHDDMLWFIFVLLFGSVFYGVRFLYKKIFRKP